MINPEDLKPIVYELVKFRDDYERRIRIEQVNLELRYQPDGSEKYRIVMNSLVLNKKGTFEREPFPSSQTDSFLKRTRFNSIKEALAVWNKVRDKYK